MTPRPRQAVCIVCTDRFRSMEFYCNALGAEVLPAELPMTAPWLKLGDLHITLLENTDRVSTLKFSEQAMATLLLQVNDLSAVFEQALMHGARVIQRPDEDGTTFMVADPDGIIIEFMQFNSDA